MYVSNLHTWFFLMIGTRKKTKKKKEDQKEGEEKAKHNNNKTHISLRSWRAFGPLSWHVRHVWTEGSLPTSSLYVFWSLVGALRNLFQVWGAPLFLLTGRNSYTLAELFTEAKIEYTLQKLVSASKELSAKPPMSWGSKMDAGTHTIDTLVNILTSV